VSVAGECIGAIEQGLCVLVGVEVGDSEAEALEMAEKIVGLRIFEDDDGKMNRSLIDVQGELLLISQFTLLGDARKGRRPGFSNAMPKGPAEELFERCRSACRTFVQKVERGRFGADMLVEIANDGPVTILLDTRRLF